MGEVLEGAISRTERRPAAAASAEVVRLSELIGALSFALDLSEGEPPGHALRCCWIGLEIGRRLGLRPQRMADLYYTLLLKDAGGSAASAPLWQICGGDERAVKRNVKAVDLQNRAEARRFVLRNTGVGDGAVRRVRRLLRIARNADALARGVIAARSERGALIAERLGFGDRVALGVRSLDEHWNGKGWPDGLAATAIPLESRIALLAQVIEVFHSASGRAAALREIELRSGTWFDPSLVMLFHDVARAGRVWEGLTAEALEVRVAALEPATLSLPVGEAGLDAIAAAFADVVDAKSRFTFGHSRRVAWVTEAIVCRLGFPEARRRALHRAALLHDLGKLGVSNAILDKPGPLERGEWTEIRRHPTLTEEILGRIGIFSDLARIAGAHHERLDGTGYPKGLAGSLIPLDARILATADMFDAITARRPYRGPVPIMEALSIMERERDTGLDGNCLDALRAVAVTGQNQEFAETRGHPAR